MLEIRENGSDVTRARKIECSLVRIPEPTASPETRLPFLDPGVDLVFRARQSRVGEDGIHPPRTDPPIDRIRNSRERREIFERARGSGACPTSSDVQPPDIRRYPTTGHPSGLGVSPCVPRGGWPRSGDAEVLRDSVSAFFLRPGGDSQATGRCVVLEDDVSLQEESAAVLAGSSRLAAPNVPPPSPLPYTGTGEGGGALGRPVPSRYDRTWSFRSSSVGSGDEGPTRDVYGSACECEPYRHRQAYANLVERQTSPVTLASSRYTIQFTETDGDGRIEYDQAMETAGPGGLIKEDIPSLQESSTDQAMETAGPGGLIKEDIPSLQESSTDQAMETAGPGGLIKEDIPSLQESSTIKRWRETPGPGGLINEDIPSLQESSTIKRWRKTPGPGGLINEDIPSLQESSTDQEMESDVDPRLEASSLFRSPASKKLYNQVMERDIVPRLEASSLFRSPASKKLYNQVMEIDVIQCLEASSLFRSPASKKLYNHVMEIDVIQCLEASSLFRLSGGEICHAMPGLSFTFHSEQTHLLSQKFYIPGDHQSYIMYYQKHEENLSKTLDKAVKKWHSESDDDDDGDSTTLSELFSSGLLGLSFPLEFQEVRDDVARMLLGAINLEDIAHVFNSNQLDAESAAKAISVIMDTFFSKYDEHLRKENYISIARMILHMSITALLSREQQQLTSTTCLPKRKEDWNGLGHAITSKRGKSGRL
ncbi:unnamed protein product [Darwinula stevensoni]|uniref:Uncharacterized protein n=1 Tax=Darwinula stevensoni TaxID=69355 RepID=A0A7R9ADD2_9CRUS|nr:unnamed protein product [Darwinula stevensoni]CAG0901195.1 unnamed protein product [Darwinula stevensoni]